MALKSCHALQIVIDEATGGCKRRQGLADFTLAVTQIVGQGLVSDFESQSRYPVWVPRGFGSTTTDPALILSNVWATRAHVERRMPLARCRRE